MRAGWMAAWVLTAAAAAGGCATAKATAALPMPTLAPPEVPPRVVAEYLPDPPLPAEPVSPEAVASPLPPRRPARRDVARPDAAETEEPAPPLAAAPAAPPALVLQMPGTSAKAEESVRQLLSQAARDLGRVDYRALDGEGREQYETARRFMQQADDALKARNVMFAGKLADKAAAMASVLLR